MSINPEKSSTEKIEDTAANLLADWKRQERWGGIESPFQEKYSTGGIVPHQLISEAARSLGGTDEKFKLDPMEQFNRMSQERKDSAKKCSELQEQLRKVLTEKYQSREEPAALYEGRAERRAREYAWHMEDQGLYATVAALVPDSVFDSLPAYEYKNYETYWSRREIGPVEVVSAEQASEDGLIRLQVGVHTKMNPSFEGELTRGSAEVKESGRAENGDVFAEDKVLYMIDKSGNPMIPENSPQEVQFNEEETEVTIREDNVGMIVLEHQTQQVEYIGMGKRITPFKKIVVIADREMENTIYETALEYQRIGLTDALEGANEMNEMIGNAEPDVTQRYFSELRDNIKEHGHLTQDEIPSYSDVRRSVIQSEVE